MKREQKNYLVTFASVIALAAVLCSLAGCAATTTANNAAINTSQKEMLLTQAGFKAKTVTTPKQQQQLAKLAVNKVSAVKYKGNLYYVYPTAKKDQILFGKQPQFNAYKKMLAARMTKSQSPAAMTEDQRERQNMPGGVYNVGETAGPNRITVEDFDGFGPLQDDPMWQ